MPDALVSLARLGVTLRPEHCFPFRGIRFLGGGDAVDASFPNGGGVGIRRTHLHQALIDRAEEAGATLLWGTTVKGLSASGVTLDRGVVNCGWVVGADGENSRVPVGWPGDDTAQVLRFGFPAPLPWNQATGGLRGNLLGLRLADLRDADWARGNLRGGDLAGFASASGSGLTVSCGALGAAEERRCYDERARCGVGYSQVGIDGIATASCCGRRFGIGGRDHGRGTGGCLEQWEWRWPRRWRGTILKRMALLTAGWRGDPPSWLVYC